MAKKAQQLGHSQAIIIAPQDKWGSRMATALSKQWQAEGGYIRETWYFTEQTDFTTAIAELLHINRDTDKKLMKRENNKMRLAQQRRQDFDIIFLLAPLSSARQIVPLLPYFPIYGATGMLTEKAHEIHRQLPCATIQNGQTAL